MEDQHIFHHYGNDGLRINMSIEKNSRGFNYSVTIVGAKSVVEAIDALKEAEATLKVEYGSVDNLPPMKAVKAKDDIPF